MKRLIVKQGDWYANIPVDKIERDDNLIFAYKDKAFCGMFDLGSVDMLYTTEENK